MVVVFIDGWPSDDIEEAGIVAREFGVIKSALINALLVVKTPISPHPHSKKRVDNSVLLAQLYGRILKHVVSFIPLNTILQVLYYSHFNR